MKKMIYFLGSFSWFVHSSVLISDFNENITFDDVAIIIENKITEFHNKI